MGKFKLVSDYAPTGDQPEAIKQLTDGIKEGEKSQVLLGVTGSGKTFTVANVIANVNKPTLILSHNKTLAAQLYSEMKSFFPGNAVEYYVSYYDYYQPEAYLPQTDTYIEKDLAINEEIDRLRLSAVSSLLSGRKDVVVVSSVSCIYGMGGPVEMAKSVISIKRGQKLDRNVFLRSLVNALYVRNDLELKRGNFRVRGDTVDVFMAYSDNVLRVSFWDDEVDAIEEMDSVMKDEFSLTFQKIQKEFSEVFKELFKGGKATLTLTNPDDLLTTGIDITASPPGKKLSNISLLSGGEKTLTAISLLFAILNVRTVPFCLFDEVEAALDEANVDNFGEYLDHYKNKTQFLLITHKKKTMEYANTLYGITMQESGVSKLVSVKLSDK